MENTANTAIIPGSRGIDMSDRMETTEKERIEETEKIDIISFAGDFLNGL